MPKLVWMPFYWTDFKADTAHLSYEEQGLYLNVLGELWGAPHQRLPNDPAWLARKFRLDERGLDVLKRLIAEFCQTDGNFITQKRLTAQWKKQAEISHRRSVSAKRRERKKKDEHRVTTACPPRDHGVVITKTKTKTRVREKEKPSQKEKANGRRSPRSRLPKDWQPNDSVRQLAADRGIDLDYEMQIFRNHADAHDRRLVDWNAGARQWLLKADKQGIAQKVQGKRPPRIT